MDPRTRLAFARTDDQPDAVKSEAFRIFQMINNKMGRGSGHDISLMDAGIAHASLVLARQKLNEPIDFEHHQRHSGSKPQVFREALRSIRQVLKIGNSDEAGCPSRRKSSRTSSRAGPHTTPTKPSTSSPAQTGSSPRTSKNPKQVFTPTKSAVASSSRGARTTPSSSSASKRKAPEEDEDELALTPKKRTKRLNGGLPNAIGEGSTSTDVAGKPVDPGDAGEEDDDGEMVIVQPRRTPRATTTASAQVSDKESPVRTPTRSSASRPSRTTSLSKSTKTSSAVSTSSADGNGNSTPISVRRSGNLGEGTKKDTATESNEPYIFKDDWLSPFRDLKKDDGEGHRKWKEDVVGMLQKVISAR